MNRLGEFIVSLFGGVTQEQLDKGIADIKTATEQLRVSNDNLKAALKSQESQESQESQVKTEKPKLKKES